MTAVPTDGAQPGLAASNGPLLARHDLLLVDLDGVAYLGDRPIDGAAAALSEARDAGLGVAFVTNNAARPPSAVAEQLEAMGVAARPGEVMTSAIAAAEVLAGRLPAGSPVLVVGGAGVRDALVAAGLSPVEQASDSPLAVLQGFAPEVGWRSLAEASIVIRRGAPWVATNADLTLPSPRGPLPGNGSLVAALRAATEAEPEVIGKPAPALFRAAMRAHGGDRPLVIGDRLDTDIAGARAAGLPSLLVLSGVSSPHDLLHAPPEQRPDYIGRDLRALLIDHPAPGAATASVTAGRIEISPRAGATPTPDGLDGLRALVALAWSAEGDRSPDELDLEAYDDALDSLHLDER